MSLGVGVIDVKSLVIEDPAAIAGRLVEAAQIVPAERIAVSTDCGLLNLKREHAARKIEALVEGARIARETLSGSYGVRSSAASVRAPVSARTCTSGVNDGSNLSRWDRSPGHERR